MGGRPIATELRVRYAETDQMGVVYHSNYLIWCEIGRTDYIRALGTPYAELERNGVALAVSEASLRCHAPARYDDVVRVETLLTEVRSRTVTFDYVIAHAGTGARLATARTILVSLDREGKVSALPGDVRAFLSNGIGG
ncbi:MAG TPA: thioesterase family protein [Gemmatimonadaceae bacterium]|nr:thioesterase family protein [Gemmatimonadaceae bacterium]